MAFSYKKQIHKSKGKASKIPHPVGASPHSGARKNKIYDALVARENKVRSKTAPLPKKKPKQTRDSLPIEETMKSIGRLNKIQNATKKPKKKAGGKVEKRFIGGLVRKGITKLLSKTPKPKTKLKSKETSADRIGNPRGKKNITKKQKKPINSSDLIFPMAAGTAYAASKNTKKKKAGGKVEYKMGGGKVKYRSIGGKVIDGNDITKMIYD